MRKSIPTKRDSRADAEKSGRTRLSPDARRTQLLDHAICAFAHAGIERAVHADVAARAGVSTPTVFKYFPTREALVDAVLDRVEQTVADLITLIPSGANLNPGQMATSLATVLGNLCETKPDLMKVALAWSVAFSSVRDRFLIFQDQTLSMLQARMAAQGELEKRDRTDARILLGASLLYIRMYFDGTTEDMRRRYVTRMAELFEAESGTKP